jgi:bifunctional DNase/RNase
MAKKRNFTAIFIIVILISVFASFAYYQFVPQQGFVEVNVIKVIDTSVIVGNNCTGIVAQTSPDNAESIQLGLENKISDRPNAHDTLAAIFRAFNITVEGVEITEIKNQNYMSFITIKQGDKILKLDSRPSDAIAIALRTNSKIYINSTLLSQNGQNICL